MRSRVSGKIVSTQIELLFPDVVENQMPLPDVVENQMPLPEAVESERIRDGDSESEIVPRIGSCQRYQRSERT